jgi:methylenetetrahydrofolate dehydrogenase (NADP+)/methenyltetrahydrofolate cyclohydrolase
LPDATCYNTAMKLLNGRDLADYIKERQSREVRSVRQSLNTQPKLAIILTIDHPAINVYVHKKEQYGSDLEVDVAVFKVTQDEVPDVIKGLNADNTVHGIIVQLPLERPEETDAIVNLVAPEKDVDALGTNAKFDPATPMAILWLLAGYNIELRGKKIVLIGRGKLVGRPLERMLIASGFDVSVVDRSTEDIKGKVGEADVIITATGSPSVLKSDMIKRGAVVIDAGVAGEHGKTAGDLDPSVYEERDDITVTPLKGGVGPLTVCALFENVIRAARRSASSEVE